MPRQLPGLRWDDQRQRYFPLTTTTTTTLPPPPPRAVQRSPFRALADLRSVLRTVHKDTLIHQIQSSQIALTSKVTRSAVAPRGHYSAFQTVCHDGRVWWFAGDTHGWLYLSIADSDQQRITTINEWQDQFPLFSEVSSVGVSGTACVATSFGPECRLLYVPLDPSLQGIYSTRIDSRAVHDIWIADLQASRLVLGANKQAVIFDDVATCASMQRLPTGSDVLALAQRQNVLYTGLRNGGILQFDARLQKSRIYPLFTTPHTNSVITLRHLRDYQLLASFIDGGISSFDLRFPIRTPLMTFTGNCNSYTARLPLAVDPSERFLFAAGQDNRIRLWSLVSGGPALDPGKVFQRPFEHRIAALQVVEEIDGMCLWAASGSELYKYNLNHRVAII